MKIENEVTGKAKGVNRNNVFSVELFLNDRSVGFLNMNLETERVDNSLFDFFDIAENFRGYKAFLGLLGIEVPKLSLAHWTPTHSQKYYAIDMFGDIQDSRFSNCDFTTKLLKSYNIFPSRELAEKAVNLSKLERMILLWQYANDCLFEPDWLDGIQQKYYIIYDSRDENACYDYNFNQKSKNIYFEKREHVKAFIDMYEAEIKELMNIK